MVSNLCSRKCKGVGGGGGGGGGDAVSVHACSYGCHDIAQH